MVQRKVPNKLGIKHLILDNTTQLVNSQTHDKLNKIMKKSRPVKRSDELPLKKKRTPTSLHDSTPPKQSPNYMKSTSSFEARKEGSHKTPNPSKSSKKHEASSGNKGSRTSSLKLTKTPSFKPLRPSKKVILCEDLDAQKATCSSTLKESKFPDYLELSPGGSELEGTSAMKVCPYTYCSLNGHHHAPLPPLKCYMSAGRRALKSFKLGCLSPRQTRHPVKKNDKNLREEVVDMEATPITPKIEDGEKKESRDFFIEIHRKDEGKSGSQDFECSEIDWEEGYCSALYNGDEQTFKMQEIDDGVHEDQIGKMGVENLYSELQELYDEESVSSGAWTEEDGDSESDSSSNQQSEDQDFVNYNDTDVSSITTEANVNDKTDDLQDVNDKTVDDLQDLNFSIGDQKNFKCSINYEQEKTYQESKTVPDFAEKSKEGTDTHHTTIIYNIIHYNISIFFNGEKTENGKSVTVQVPVTAKTESLEEVNEAMEEEGMSREDDEASDVNHMVADEQLSFDIQNVVSNQQLNDSYLAEIEEEPASGPKEGKTHEITSETDKKKTTTTSFCKRSTSNEELQDPCRLLTRGKKLNQDMEYDDSQEFNPRGPNFLPEVADPDSERVDLKHQNIDERKNAEEWMVDYALQQAVNTIAPKRKVSLLVKAFEKVMPIPNYEPPRNRNTSKAFTNARPMQACS